MRQLRAHRSPGLRRSLELLSMFLVASAVILGLGAATLSTTLSESLRAAALEDSARDVAAYTDAVLAPSTVHGARVLVTPAARRRLTRTMRLPKDVRGLDVYTRDGRLVLSTGHPSRVGRKRTTAGLEKAVKSGQPSAAFFKPLRGPGAVVRVWAPLRSRQGAPVGAVEVTLDSAAVDTVVADTTRNIWVAVALVFGLVWLALAVLVRGASWRLGRQNDELAKRSQELRKTVQELEATLLETIETLNAAVEARDPYTAGHSQRVRRVSLAIGHALDLPTKQLGALSTAALFHDIGKIGMPDSILTKPDTLTRAELAVMREHVNRGVEIVSRISSLRDSVPAIRHHHERWDGLGYPDGLGGDDIPVEAAIIAIADAWDAMTTDRPYATALDLNAAMLQIRAGRGRQFNPAVVDAFWKIARRQPSQILPPESPTAVIAVV